MSIVDLLLNDTASMDIDEVSVLFLLKNNFAVNYRRSCPWSIYHNSATQFPFKSVLYFLFFSFLSCLQKVGWDMADDNFLESLLKMEEHSEPFEFLPIDEDFISSAATSPTYDNAESSSCSDSGIFHKH